MEDARPTRKRARSDSSAAKPAKKARVAVQYGRFAGRKGELKFFDTANSFLFDTTGEVPATGQLTLIPQGTTESTRIGGNCTVKSVQIRGRILYTPAAAANASGTAHMYLVVDKQANGAAAAVTDVFTGTALADAMHNLSNSQRFVVLKAWHWVFNGGAGVTTAYNSMAKYMEYYTKCTIPIEYSSTAGVIAELKSNNIFLIAGADGNTDDLISFTGQTRLRFSDK